MCASFEQDMEPCTLDDKDTALKRKFDDAQIGDRFKYPPKKERFGGRPARLKRDKENQDTLRKELRRQAKQLTVLQPVVPPPVVSLAQAGYDEAGEDGDTDEDEDEWETVWEAAEQPSTASTSVAPPFARPIAPPAMSPPVASLAAPPSDAPSHAMPKPTGPVPLADGQRCTWDGEAGCWRRADGSTHVVMRNAKRHSKAQAEQPRRRAACERIDAAVIARLQAQGKRCGELGERPYFLHVPLYTHWTDRVTNYNWQLARERGLHFDWNWGTADADLQNYDAEARRQLCSEGQSFGIVELNRADVAVTRSKEYWQCVAKLLAGAQPSHCCMPGSPHITRLPIGR